MREEHITRYIADDGTPFNENKEACKNYEDLCHKIKLLLGKGTVMFWDHYEKYMNFDLYEYTFQNETSYLDWLLNRLSADCGYIVVNVHPCSAEWADVWEITKLYSGMGNEAIRIENTYQEGDLLVYDCLDRKWHNISLVERNYKATKERLNLAVANLAMANRDKWEGK